MCLNIWFVFFVLMWTTYGFVSFLDPFILFIHSFYTVTVQFPSTQALQNIMENVKVSSEGRATFLHHVFLFFHCTHSYQQLGVTASALITLTTHSLDYLKNSISQLVSCVFRSKWSFSFQNQTNTERQNLSGLIQLEWNDRCGHSPQCYNKVQHQGIHEKDDLGGLAD